MKLNIGCGGKRIPGYTGIDAVQRPAVDIIANADNIPLDSGVAEEIMAIHLMEHFYQWEVPGVLREWYRLLQPGGKLVLELPDVVKCAQNLVDNVLKGGKHLDQLSYWGLYGDPRLKDPFMTHRWGWTFQTLGQVLHDVGYVNIIELPTMFHPAGKEHRDFRVEAQKP